MEVKTPMFLTIIKEGIKKCQVSKFDCETIIIVTRNDPLYTKIIYNLTFRPKKTYKSHPL